MKDIKDGPDSVPALQEIDWTEISKRGLLMRINREIMHPLGLAVFRDDTGISEGAFVSPDGKWVYAEDEENLEPSSKEMSISVALDFADNPRPHHSLQAPADTNGELYRALKVLSAAYRSVIRPI